MIFISDDGSCKCFDDLRDDRVKPRRARWHLRTVARLCAFEFAPRTLSSPRLASSILIPAQRHRRHGPLHSRASI
jgi:hypothetical protein